ncbi:DUF2273 domain-containing protein [Hydrogenibacillus schlegelii]|uniref:DUF2273 domain-containing protein n=1 Tax=Hydrogenibacillus schlegelii TaxID=1484 RepID=A0A132N8J6_HYDSH|nr:DUF2273 domain-containing protein [Hydrogenibacillus schlegelii]KWX06330.1 hypothetical protein TR75_06305 [Hydrogenibacillus schlegelii]MBT9283290.1 DUF2273 domain-containing protein [Hydrogenibacillus schlegelii]OAR03234.1 hypothetical protein SA87_04950 [Hydrogenibacillus schlegelii]PTQ53739.1 MAG: hypothetical protein HSCHL_1507 [Hydrogenibacillus schlegelii]
MFDWQAHLGKILGTAYALLVSAVYLAFGAWRAFVVAVLVALGFWIGSRYDRKDRLADWIMRFLPESFFTERERPFFERDRR